MARPGIFIAMRPLTPDAAETIALQALAFLASDSDRLERFLSLTGLRPETVRTAAAQSGFLIGVLDHFASDESLLLSFTKSAALDPAAVALARRALSGPTDFDSP
ncbi:MAG TPA: DUF3572 domain-containing protein [Beijerinckiaceae bacterium]|nr:DUF3572 domain-containing protein [Beijerinckiaceae bacterium]